MIFIFFGAVSLAAAAVVGLFFGVSALQTVLLRMLVLLAVGLINFVLTVVIAGGDKNSALKTLWIAVLYIIPVLGAVLFLTVQIAGAKGAKQRRMKRIAEAAEPYKACGAYEGTDGAARYIAATGGYGAYSGQSKSGGGSFQYFGEGAAVCRDVLDKIGCAKEYIWIEFFMIREGELLNHLLEILLERRTHGVEVRIVYDKIASDLTKKTLKRLKRDGIEICAYAPRPAANLPYRNHRKLIVIDGTTAYMGGFNIADNYVEACGKYGHWKDAGIRIDGAAARGIGMMFLKDWYYVTKTSPNFGQYFPPCREVGGNAVGREVQTLIPYTTEPTCRQSPTEGLILSVISSAQEFLYISAPYLVPEPSVISALKVKAREGIDVRLVIPEIPDRKVVFALTKDTARDLAEAGVKIYRYPQGFIHSKVIATERGISVGSINLDYRSFYQQYESGVYISNADAQDVLADFRAMFCPKCELTASELDSHGILYKLGLGVLRLLAPLF